MSLDRNVRWPLQHPTSAILIMTWFSMSVLFALGHSSFQWLYVLIEAKILLFVVGGCVLGGRSVHRGSARFIVTISYTCFVGGCVLFALIGAGGRLSLLNESNYTLVAGGILSILMIRVWKIEVFSPNWIMIVSIFGFCCFLGQSRTNFAALATYLVFSTISSRRPLAAALSICAAAAVLIPFASDILFRVSRGAIGGNVEVDRFIFLKEYMRYISEKDILEVLFGSNVGVPLYTNVPCTLR